MLCTIVSRIMQVPMILLFRLSNRPRLQGLRARSLLFLFIFLFYFFSTVINRVLNKCVITYSDADVKKKKKRNLPIHESLQCNNNNIPFTILILL